MTIDHNNLSSQDHDGSHLTPAQVRAIDGYVQSICQLLDLGHWKVYVAKDLPNEGTIMMIEPTDGRRIAMLYVSRDWWQDRNADEKRCDIAHEILHLAHHEADSVLRRFFDHSGDISDYVKDIVMREFKVAIERMVDSLSYVIAPTLPPWIHPVDDNRSDQ